MDLRETLERSYGLRVQSVTPVAMGFTGRCFAVDSDRGPLFVKIGAARRTASLLLELGSCRIGARLPAPVLTLGGEPGSRCAAGPFVVLTAVEGQTPADWPHWSPDVLERLGRALAKIHASTKRLRPYVPPGDPLAISFEEPLRGALEHEALAERSHEVHSELDRLHRLRTKLALRPENLVVCHTDCAGDNLVVDEDGGLGILDWDEAALAHPASDFILVIRDQTTGEPLRHVLDAYVDAGGRPALSIDLLAFLLLRRFLEDTGARASIVSDPLATAARRKQALSDIDTWGSRQWRRLDQTLDVVRESWR